MNSLEALVSLNMLMQLGSGKLGALLGHFSRAEEIFRAGRDELSAFLPQKLCEDILSFDAGILDREIKGARDLGLEIITLLGTDYPRNLKEIPGPAPVLYLRGEIRDSDIFSVGIVGSRHPSWYGLSSAERFSFELSQNGLTIVSGLARGIDTAAHRGSLKAGGRTIAVMGSGFRHIYPPENADLSRRISENGAVVSEFPLDTRPLAQNFPRRNRIISGLSLGVLVVEAAKNSGALITADFALEQGREVFALPGQAGNATSFGTNELIKQGAKLTTGCQDILEEFPFLAKDTQAKTASCLFSGADVLSDKGANKLYDYISEEAAGFDELMEKTHLSSAQLAQLILDLRLKKLIRQLPGKYYARN